LEIPMLVEAMVRTELEVWNLLFTDFYFPLFSSIFRTD
jgi:hypothetical protein